MTFFVSGLACAALALVGLTADWTRRELGDDPVAVAAFAAVTVALVGAAAYASERRASVSVGGIGLLALGFAFGPGIAAIGAVVVAVVHLVRTRGRVGRAVFNAAALALACGLGAATYHAFVTAEASVFMRLAAAAIAGVVFWIVNVGLLAVAMSLAEGGSPLALWRERFAWVTAHCLTFGPVALTLTASYEEVGPLAMAATLAGPALLAAVVRRRLSGARTA